MALTFAPLAIPVIYGNYIYAYPTFELSNAVLLLAKLLLESKTGAMSANPLLSGNPLPNV